MRIVLTDDFEKQENRPAVTLGMIREIAKIAQQRRG